MYLKKAYVNTDSLSALHAVVSITQILIIVYNYVTILNTLKERNKIVLHWVSSHSDITGNDAGYYNLTNAKGQKVLVAPAPLIGII